MIRQVIEIDQEKCNGCGLCVTACHEGAIGLVDGKARLLRDDYCDGLGDCLPACPTNAISFVEREAAPYDEAAVIAAQMAKAKTGAHASMPATGCPGSMAQAIKRDEQHSAAGKFASASAGEFASSAPASASGGPLDPAVARPSGDAIDSGSSTLTGGITVTVPVPPELSNWPVQIKLAPINAPYFQGADLLIAADCCAFAYGAFHQDFIRGRVCLIGCPKLDGVDYTEKLTEILRENDIRSVRVARMQVPCCGGIEHAARTAVQLSGKEIPISVATIANDGSIICDE